MYLYAVLALAAIVGLVILIPYRVTLDYQLLQGNDDLNVEIAWLGIPLLRRRLPLISSILESAYRARDGARGEEGAMDDALQSHDTEQELVEGIEGLLWFGRRYRSIFDAIYSFAFSKSPEKMQMPHGQQLLLSAAASLYRFIHLEKLYWYSRVG